MNSFFIYLVFICSGASSLNWGIAGTGKQASDFVKILEELPRDHKVISVASKQLKNANIFAKEHKIGVVHQTFENLAKDKNIDIIYVALLSSMHYTVTKQLLKHQVHVLCQAPLTTNDNHTKELLELAKKNKLFLMEAVWSRSLPVYSELKKILQSQELGKIKEVFVNYGVDFDKNDSHILPLPLGGATALDLGVSLLQFQQIVFQNEKPSKFVATGYLNSRGSVKTIHSIISYSDDKSATLIASGQMLLPNEAMLYGTNGTLRIPNFWAPSIIIKNGEPVEYRTIKLKRQLFFENAIAIIYTAEEARKCIQAGKLESEKMTHAETLQLSRLTNALKMKIGVKEFIDSHFNLGYVL